MCSSDLLDDPIKNAEEAYSQLQRDRVWDWWTSTGITRLEPGANILGIMHRWHEDDLFGRILKRAEEAGKPFEVMKFPALAGDKDLLGRKPGEPLWPQRITMAELNTIRLNTTRKAWSSLYQQEPSIEGGGYFKREWFRYFTEDNGYMVMQGPNGKRAVPLDQTVCYVTTDFAMTTKTTADFSVLMVVRTHGNDMMVCDMLRGRWDTPTLEDMLHQIHRRYNPRFIGVEKVAYGISVIQRFKADGVPIRELSVVRDKIARSTDAQIMMQNGNIYFRKDAPWLDEFEPELLAFDSAPHDDQVDAIGLIGRMLDTMVGGRVPAKPVQQDKWERAWQRRDNEGRSGWKTA